MSHNIKISELNKVCRACLQTNRNMLSLQKQEILDMFQICTSINVSFNQDKFPNKICSNCFSKVTHLYDFKQLCEKSNKILLDIINNEYKDNEHRTLESTLITVNTVKESNTNHLDNNRNDNTSDLETICSSNEKSGDFFERKNSFEIQSIEQETEEYKCKVCQRILSSKSSLRRHTRMHSDIRYTCHVCNKVFYVEKYYIKHMKQHEDGIQYQCDYCQLKFVEIPRLTTHIRNKHTPIKHVVCTVCSKTFITKALLDRHLKVHSTEKNHICTVCDKRFLKRALLNKHMKHHSEKMHHCYVCYGSFVSEYLLNLHTQRMHSNGERKKKICVTCGKSVTNMSAHIRYYHDQTGTIKCDICSKIFRAEYHLKYHIKKDHTGEYRRQRPFLCTICGYACESRPGLKLHSHKHSNERNYKCTLCEKTYKTDKAVRSHIRYSHNQVKPFKCEVCDKHFATKHLLHIHTRVHTGERPYKCEICEQSFSQKSTLKTHQKVHGIERTVLSKLEEQK